MQLKLKIHAEDTPLTVIVEPLGWDYTLAPEQSAWFGVEAYGERAVGTIPANAALVFEVDLVQILYQPE